MASKGQESVGFQTGMVFGHSILWPKLLRKKKCIFQGEGKMARTQTLQLQYFFTLRFHFMKVLSLLFFTERLDKASNIGLFFEKLEKIGKKAKLPEGGIDPQISE
jgi:hypothetical protein